ncbi:phosphoglycolate phosphatase [Primorskyibacter sp. S87]|uniref:phosphoglycolate phosphatase n=1 Tax=Primorskyibacter sp. S87 TaxID=3415126 RepID=UPI003C7DB2F6
MHGSLKRPHRGNIVFDLDGTLVDSAPDIQAAVNRMLEGVGAELLDIATTVSFIGNGLPKLVERTIRARGLPIERHAELTRVTLAHYNRAATEATRPYAGVAEALTRLKAEGYSLGICTNKPKAPARSVLAGLDLSGFFDVVIGGDTLSTRKPDPAMLNVAFDALPNGAGVYVGDSEVDAETAHRAGIPFLLFTEGYRKSAVEELPHQARFAEFTALPALVGKIMGHSPA